MPHDSARPASRAAFLKMAATAILAVIAAGTITVYQPGGAPEQAMAAQELLTLPSRQG